MATEQWEDGIARCFGMLLDGRAQESGVKRRGSDATLLLIYNAHHDVVNFTLPSVPEGRHWQGLIDTNRPDSQIAAFDFGDVYAVTGRSLLALGLATEDSATRRLRQGTGTDLDATDSLFPDSGPAYLGPLQPGRRQPQVDIGGCLTFQRAPEDPVPLRGAYHAPRNGFARRRTSDAPGTKVPAVCGCGSLPLPTSCKLFPSFAATSP